MATVTNPAKLTSVISVFGASGSPANLAAYYRGGARVPSGNSSAISTTAVGLALSQFNGVTAVASLTASASPSSITGSATGLPTSHSVTTNATTVTASGGNGTFAHSWSLVSSSNVTSPVVNTAGASASVTGTVSDGVTGTGTIRDTVTSGGSTYQVNVTFTLYYAATGCVVTNSYLGKRRRAGTAREGQLLRVTDPMLQAHNTVNATIRRAQRLTMRCVRIVAANGAWLECSITAPIPVQTGGFVAAPDLLGHKIATAINPTDDIGHVPVEWSEVVEVRPIGRRRVQLIFVDDRCFWASGDGRRYILHHNQKPISIP